jgi:uncharacterized protein YeaO (DUF488 family)
MKLAEQPWLRTHYPGRRQMSTRRDIRLRRIYEEPADDDGIRVLVDRRWPRGVSKEHAAVDEWCREVAPSDGLRSWYGHLPEKFDQFVARYTEELDDPERTAALRHLDDMAARGPRTLLTGTKDVAISHATVLAQRLQH